MFYEELEDYYRLEQHTTVRTVTELSSYLVNTYHREKGGKLYKKEPIVQALTNVLGNLFLKYQTKVFIDKTPQEKYDESYRPQLLFPMNNNLYVKNSYNPEEYKHVYKNIQKFGLTCRNKDHIIAILEQFNLCTITIGTAQKTNTTIVLNNYMEWRPDIFQRSVGFNLQIYHAFAKDYLYGLSNPDSKKVTLPNAYIKRDGRRIQAPQELIDAVDRINELWPEELARFHYTRVFSENIHTGGRLYSLFNNMPKTERKKLIMDNFGYREIDFTAFVPNAMKMFVDGESYKERPYNKVSRVLINSKYKKKGDSGRRKDALQAYEEILADLIKRPILMMMNQSFYTEKTINQNKAVWNSLVGSGLANTPEELRMATTYRTYQSDDAAYRSACIVSDAKSRNWELYEYRSKRWKENFPDLECPHFIVKPSNLLAASKKALKEIDIFLLTSNWGWTQYIESELLLRISVDFKEDGLLPLFIHDAFIVPGEYCEKYKNLSERYILEIIEEYRESILTDENITKLHDDLNELLRRPYFVKQLVLMNRGSRSGKEIKSLTMKIIKYMREEIMVLGKEGDNKFYYSREIDSYWSLYWIVKGKVEEMIKR